MIIKEMIVVEGKDDTKALARVAKCDTIETNGSAINDVTIEKIRLAAERRGVIIFTDPDYPGEKIRRTIEAAVPGCKHAFLPKELAQNHRGKIGVENASDKALLDALEAVRSPGEVAEEQITLDDLIASGLIAGTGARQRREDLGRKLKIGYANGKQLHRRLVQFRISKQEFIKALNYTQEKEE
ncbi:ribonuclease M5 [Alteribacter aurantiacus]|uniref:ribonuclease M5 n=1 Tax=Alteribacter aurantiacus TaxID=254410 RepID=UPI0004168A68|nr:ribonuclease M5 [Alteribacter aurantiacus]